MDFASAAGRPACDEQGQAPPAESSRSPEGASLRGQSDAFDLPIQPARADIW
ncbi:hypothetical protein [Nocardia sp. R7R-8]|uniref:hypothetical protein n=1 Tax=Nocardia sp. R7R-8 TaxID=3459304 RepID=UPI00403DCCBA